MIRMKFSTNILAFLVLVLCVLPSLTKAAPSAPRTKVSASKKSPSPSRKKANRKKSAPLLSRKGVVSTNAHLVRKAEVMGSPSNGVKKQAPVMAGPSGFKSDSNVIKSNNFPKARRVYTTNMLPGFKQDQPSLFPPGYGDAKASARVILDIGANSGEEYTLRGYKHGHTVLSFEPSPMVVGLFKRTMISSHVSLSVVNVRNEGISPIAGSDPLVHTAHRIRVFVPPHKATDDAPHVYLFPFAVSNSSRVVSFHESSCKRNAKCGKVNHVTEDDRARKGNLQVQSYRLDDLILPVDSHKIWFMKIDVEGHEIQVLQGARQLINEAKVEYIGFEFSANRRPGIDWGVGLLQELYVQGYSCFHLRGFGKCHNNRLKSPSLKCNYPFSMKDETLAPTFEQYTKVFEMKKGRKNVKPRMSDLMCKRKH